MVSGILAGAAGGAVVAIVIKAIDNYSKQFKKLDKSLKKQETGLKKLGKFLKSSGIGYLALATAAVGFGVKAVKAGIESERAMKQFELAVGDAADTMLEDMRKASQGMVSDFELVNNANKALALGIAKSQIPKLLEAATARAKVFGRTAGEAFNDLAIGIGRQSRMILDNLGIILDLDKTYGDYAESVGKTVDQLTDFDKKLALTNSIIESSKDLMIAQIFIQETMDEKLQKLSSGWDNFWNSMGTGIINLQNFAEGTTGANKALAATFDQLLNVEGAFEDTGNAILEVGNQLRTAQANSKSLLQSLRDISNINLAGESAQNVKIAEKEMEINKEKLRLARLGQEEESSRLQALQKDLELFRLERQVEFDDVKNFEQAKSDLFIAEQTNLEITKEAFQELAKVKADAFIKEQKNIEELETAQKRLLESIKDSGIITQETFDKIKDPTYVAEQDAIGKVILKTKDLISVYEEAAIARSRAGVDETSFESILRGELSKRGVSSKSGAGKSILNRFTNVGDAILRPNGEVIKTHPNDTLIATQNPGGMGGVTIIVQGNLIGLDEDDISRSLSDELNSKTSL